MTYTLTTEEERESGGGGGDRVEEIRRDMEERGKENYDMRTAGAEKHGISNDNTSTLSSSTCIVWTPYTLLS